MKILECSSKGDKRFSAFFAYVEIFGKNNSIENHYQLCKRFGDKVPKGWRDAKGKKATHFVLKGFEYDVKYLSGWYDLLWLKYLDKNPELVEFAKQYDDFNDIFKGKNTINCQADSIRKYIKQGRDFIIEENKELLNKIKYNNKVI